MGGKGAEVSPSRWSVSAKAKTGQVPPPIGFHRSQAQRRAQRISACKLEMTVQLGNFASAYPRTPTRWSRCKRSIRVFVQVLCCAVLYNKERDERDRSLEDKDFVCFAWIEEAS